MYGSGLLLGVIFCMCFGCVSLGCARAATFDMITYMHACIQTDVHTCLPAYIHTYIPTYIHACIHTYMHIYIYIYIYIYITHTHCIRTIFCSRKNSNQAWRLQIEIWILVEPHPLTRGLASSCGCRSALSSTLVRWWIEDLFTNGGRFSTKIWSLTMFNMILPWNSCLILFNMILPWNSCRHHFYSFLSMIDDGWWTYRILLPDI